MPALQTARETARSASLFDLEAEASGLIIVCLTRSGKLAEAAEAASTALTLAEQVKDELIKARVLTNLAFYYIETGDNARAIQIQHKVIAALREKGERHGEVINAANLGYNYLLLGRFKQGCEVLERTRQTAEKIGARVQATYCGLNLGIAYWRLGDFDAGAKILQECRIELTKIGDTFGEAASLSYLGMIHEARGEPLVALENFEQAREIMQRIGARGYAGDALAGIARCKLVLGDQDAALNSARGVWDYLEEQRGQGMEFPILAYQTCAKIFQASVSKEMAEPAIRKGYEALLERGEKISDETLRRTFFENVPEHKAITSSWKNAQK
jgi:tetratricopeptide (TPR) repeat protein